MLDTMHCRFVYRNYDLSYDCLNIAVISNMSCGHLCMRRITLPDTSGEHYSCLKKSQFRICVIILQLVYGAVMQI